MGDVMGKRVGLLAGLLVLSLGSGVVAQEPSPKTTPLFAPGDLASTIPSMVGDYEVAIEAGPLDVDVYEEAWIDLLLPLGKDTSDVRTADGYGLPDRNNPAFQVSAMHIAGVPAADLIEPMVDGIIDGMPEKYQAFAQVDWRIIEGRDVYAIAWTPELLEQADGGNTEAGIYHYANGEVLFQIVVPPYHAAGSPPLSEILAALP